MKLYKKLVRVVVDEVVDVKQIPVTLYTGSWVDEDDKEGIANQEKIAAEIDKEYQGWTDKKIEEKFEEVE